ncbi:MAG: CDP-glycerol glycerophosphotransferase family protein [Selenomonadaceae bacterium]|nr:CDP-glycerol glycerophosphotransferase family protein [Selenomonadaceae bacterium]
MKLTKEDRYIRSRLRQARKQARQFYYCRKYPISPKKIVFTTIEGTTGFSCNPKYIALELLKRRQDLDLVWLVDDMAKEFPPGIRKVKNTLQNRAYELSTAAVWVDNSRKQLECRKREGQFYLQTWHASLHIKPTGLDRGASFSRMAELVSRHDSAMVDILITNSHWMEAHVPRSIVYDGATCRTGSPRVDVLLNGREECRKRFRAKYGLSEDTRMMLYAPTFRSGSQGTNRSIARQDTMPDFVRLKETLTKKFLGDWVIVLRLHPQLTARHITAGLSEDSKFVIDASREDDMSEVLGACDMLLTDYSAMSFDAAYMHLPVFLYVNDLQEYIDERGGLMWDLGKLPFLKAENDDVLLRAIEDFDGKAYEQELSAFLAELEILEDSRASARVADLIAARLEGGGAA